MWKSDVSNAFFVVQVNAMPGEDAELTRWYEEQHFDDCLACDSAIAAQRFRKVLGSGPGDNTAPSTAKHPMKPFGNAYNLTQSMSR